MSLQKGCGLKEETTSCLLDIFEPPLALEYLPRSWRTSRVTLFSKPERGGCSKSKYFRPGHQFDLFLLKTLERLVERNIRGSVLLRRPIHENQHPKRAGRLVETNRHQLVTRVKRASSTRALAMGCLLT